jgi:hypothetical protein
MSIGKDAIAISNGTQQPIHESGVAAHNLQISIIADIGTQSTITSNVARYKILTIFFIISFRLLKRLDTQHCPPVEQSKAAVLQDMRYRYAITPPRVLSARVFAQDEQIPDFVIAVVVAQLRLFNATLYIGKMFGRNFDFNYLCHCPPPK